jgi:KTSC domain-containing protein
MGGFHVKRFSVSFLALVLLAGASVISPTLSTAETVVVKYRGPVDLSPFACEWVTRSSVVKRLCYDAREKYVIVNLTGTYYHYCEVPPDLVAAWRQADSMGRFYNGRVKGRFDCRVLRVPPYKREVAVTQTGMVRLSNRLIAAFSRGEPECK